VQLKKLVENLFTKQNSKANKTEVVYSAINQPEIERYLASVAVDRLAKEYISDIDNFAL